MFIVNYMGRMVGPFETADAASKWADENIVKPGINMAPWQIQRLTTPDEAHAFEAKIQAQMQLAAQPVPPHTHEAP